MNSSRARKNPQRVLRLVLIMSLAPGVTAAREIAWSADRPLTWDDFEGSVAMDAAPENVAVTAASLGWSYEYDFRHSARSCTYRITDIRSTVTFDTEHSWVRPDHRTEAVLAHEQGHFDITRIHQLIFDEAVGGLIGTAGVCEGRSTRRISAYVEDEVIGIVRPLYERVWSDLMGVQDAYDAETHHGMLADAQRRWLELIAAGLRGRRWDELSAARDRD